MIIKVTLVSWICIAMLVIVHARNELTDVLISFKEVSDSEYKDSIGSDLVKRNWVVAGLAGASTFFAGIAVGSYQLAKSARLAVTTMSVGVKYFFFWSGITLLSASVLLLLATLSFGKLINCQSNPFFLYGPTYIHS